MPSYNYDDDDKNLKWQRRNLRAQQGTLMALLLLIPYFIITRPPVFIEFDMSSKDVVNAMDGASDRPRFGHYCDVRISVGGSHDTFQVGLYSTAAPDLVASFVALSRGWRAPGTEDAISYDGSSISAVYRDRYAEMGQLGEANTKLLVGLAAAHGKAKSSGAKVVVGSLVTGAVTVGAQRVAPFSIVLGNARDYTGGRHVAFGQVNERLASLIRLLGPF